MVPTEVLNSVEVWDALLEKMPLNAMVRNLGKMSNVGLLKPMSAASKLVYNRLHDQEYLLKSRVHPVNVLAALLTYKNGHGFRGSLSWSPVPQLIDALDDAFYLTFPNAPQTGKNFYIGVDCSGSMGGGQCSGVPFMTPIVGAAAMAMVIMNREPWYHVAGYAGGYSNYGGYGSRTTSQTGMIEIGLTRKTRLDDAVKKALAVNWGSTDCSLPYKDALAKKMDVDVFINITDNETYAGSQHPFRALEDYRQKIGHDVHQIVIGMTATQCTIADPNDAKSLDVAGFDTAVPNLIADFVTAGKTKAIETAEETEESEE
jgi:60 kDa SS-A/Ro ribonucleoprotein